jgi:uncharacterized membrane protein
MLNKLFQVTPSTYFPYLYWVLGIVLFVFLSSFLVYHLRKRTENKVLRKILRPYPKYLRIFSGVGVIFIWARLSGVAFLGMRFLWILWGVLLVYVIINFYFVYQKKKIDFNKNINKFKNQDLSNKYLPKKKKK